METPQQSDSQTLAGSPPSIAASTPEPRPPSLELSTSSIEYKRELQTAVDGLKQSHQSTALQHLKHTLSRWPAPDDGHKPLNHVYHVLENDYTEEELLLRIFQPNDMAEIEALTSISETANVRLFLALVWKIKEPGEDGAYDPDNNEWGSHYIDFEDNLDDYDIGIDEEDPREEGVVLTYKVKKLYDVLGDLVVESMPLDEDHWLSIPEKFGNDAQENRDGSMGDAGLTAKHWHRKAAVLIVPRQYLIPVLANAYNHEVGIRLLQGSTGSIDPQIEYWSSKMIDTDATSDAAGILLETCEYYWSRAGDTAFELRAALPPKSIFAVLSAAVRTNNSSLLERAAEYHQGRLDVSFFEWFRQWIRDNEGPQGRTTAVRIGRIQKFKKGIPTAVKHYHQYDTIARVLDILVRDLEDSDMVAHTLLKSWADAIVHDLVVINPPHLCEFEWRGISGYFSIIDFLADPPGCFRLRVLPLIEEERPSNAFFFEVLSILRGRGRGRPHHRQQYNKLFRDVTDLFLKDINFDELEDTHGFTRFLTDAFEFDGFKKDDLHNACLNTLGAVDVGACIGEKLDEFWLPVIRALPGILKSAGVAISDGRVQKITGAALMAYTERYVGERPSTNTSNVRPLIPCDCVDCDAINPFLADPDRRMARFPVDDISRDHVKTKLRISRIDCSTAVLQVGPPHELMVRKTDVEVFEKIQEYEKRKRHAEEQVFRIPMLREILGEEDYEGIVVPILGKARTSDSG